MTTIFVASEVGSARSLIPVYKGCKDNEIPFKIIKHGYFKRFSNVEQTNLVEAPMEAEMVKWLSENNATTVVFSVNVKDTYPLSVARAASSLGIPTIHILDYWNGYKSRMELDGRGQFTPTVYAVPDQYASRMAKEEGIDPEVIVITGQPAFSELESTIDNANKFTKGELGQKLGMDPVQNWILFVSEPAADDQGRSVSENLNFRGYIEDDALLILIQAIKKSKKLFSVCVQPHPRQNIDELRSSLDSLGGMDVGSVNIILDAKSILPHVCGVVGMSSTLLYEAWLIGQPIMSIQPGLRYDLLKILKGQDGVCFIDEDQDAIEKASNWLDNLVIENTRSKRKDIHWHVGSPDRIMKIISKLEQNDSN